MSTNRNSVRALAVTLLAAALLLGTLSAALAQDTTGGTLRIGMAAPVTLDPALGSNDPEILFNRSIYDYLVEVLPDKSIVPNLASGWTVSDDGLTYTFTLEEGVTFHDGSPFTSADVVFTFNRLKELESPALNLLGPFEVSAPDAVTVVFTLETPNADFLYGVADRFALILKDGTDRPNVFGEGDARYASFNGTGPFRLVDFVDGQRAELARNENYWKADQPLLGGVTFIFIEDPITQVNALRGGQVDFIFKITPDQLSVLEGDANITLIQKATNQHPVVRLRTDVGPGTSEAVRQAFRLATDRQQLNDLVLEGRGVIGNNNPIGPGFGAFFNDTIEHPAYDPDTTPQAVCDMLAAAGYPDGIDMTLQTINVLGYDELAAVLQQQWEPACIRVEIQVNDEGFYYSDDNPNNWLQAELGITGWGDRPVVQGYLTQAYVTGGVFNETHWSDAEVDALVAEAGNTTDQAARADIYRELAVIFEERGPIIVPWFAPIFGATSAGVTGLDMAPFPGLTDLRTVSLAG
jgi:peptide/nickel transport system substrate-binding protein